MVRLEQSSLNQLVAHANERGTSASRAMVWGHVASLPMWYFVQCGPRDQSVPWIVFEDDEPMAMVFTDPKLAQRVAQSMISTDGDIRVVGLPVAAATMYVAALEAQGVGKLCINHGPNRFDAAIQETRQGV